MRDLEQLTLIFVIAIVQGAVVAGLGFIIKIVYNDWKHTNERVTEHHSALFGNPNDPTHKGIAFCVSEIKDELEKVHEKLDDIKGMF